MCHFSCRNFWRWHSYKINTQRVLPGSQIRIYTANTDDLTPLPIVQRIWHTLNAPASPLPPNSALQKLDNFGIQNSMSGKCAILIVEISDGKNSYCTKSTKNSWKMIFQKTQALRIQFVSSDKLSEFAKKVILEKKWASRLEKGLLLFFCVAARCSWVGKLANLTS